MHTISELLGKLDSSKTTEDNKSTSEEKGGASGTKPPAGSTENDGGHGKSADSGRDQSENSLTYTKEQVQVVQRSAHQYVKVFANKILTNPKI